MRTTVHVQHLSRYLTGFREINHGFHYVLDVRDCTHRRQRFQEVLRVACSQRRVNDARRDRVEANFLLRIFRVQAARNGFSPPFVIIGTDAVISAMGLAASEAVIVTTLTPNFCVSICLTARCVT